MHPRPGMCWGTFFAEDSRVCCKKYSTLTAVPVSEGALQRSGFIFHLWGL